MKKLILALLLLLPCMAQAETVYDRYHIKLGFSWEVVDYPVDRIPPPPEYLLFKGHKIEWPYDIAHYFFGGPDANRGIICSPNPSRYLECNSHLVHVQTWGVGFDLRTWTLYPGSTTNASYTVTGYRIAHLVTTILDYKLVDDDRTPLPQPVLGPVTTVTFNHQEVNPYDPRFPASASEVTLYIPSYAWDWIDIPREVTECPELETRAKAETILDHPVGVIEDNAVHHNCSGPNVVTCEATFKPVCPSTGQPVKLADLAKALGVDKFNWLQRYYQQDVVEFDIPAQQWMPF